MTTTRNGKATHLGTCQACGRFQKLPSGVLAVHGYTTRWGFFSGACAGSGRKPFENSTDYIAEGITSTTRRAAVLREEAATVRSADVTGRTKEFWFHQYVPATWRVRHSSSRWVRVTATFSDDGRMESITYPDGATDRRWWKFGLTATSEEIASTQNNLRADALEKEAKKFDAYVAWQSARLANWTPEPLTAIT